MNDAIKTRNELFLQLHNGMSIGKLTGGLNANDYEQKLSAIHVLIMHFFCHSLPHSEHVKAV